MATKDVQEQLKEILAYGIHRGNETQVTVQELVQELSTKLADMLGTEGQVPRPTYKEEVPK